MKLSRTMIQRMIDAGKETKGGGAGTAGGGGGGGGSAAYADEAGHALTADEATHATSADTATNAGHALTADEATHATSATDVDANSPAYLRWLRKDIADTAAEVITFAKGIISTLKSYFNGGIEVTGGTKTDSLNATGNASVGGTLGVTGNTTLGGTLNVTGKTTGTTADFTDVTMDNLGKSNDRVVKIWADDIDAQDIATENLNVTKEAHFTKLVVDELLSNKGAIILSSANCVIEAVSEVQTYYEIFFASTDRDGNTVSNSWRTGDMALCLTFKAEGAGTFADVQNRYYWRKVTVASDETISGVTYHVIRLSKVSGEYDGSTVPEAGDNLVQLGYTGNDAAYRQSAVILSSYPTMDAGVTPPSLAFYKGINDFSLSTHRYTFMDGLSNEFIGNFKILVNGSYTNLTTVLATIEGLVTTVQKYVSGKNLLPCDGWTDYHGELLGMDNYNEETQALSNKAGSGFDDVLYSQIFFLEAGEYTYSHYCGDANVRVYVYYDDSGQRLQNPNDYIDTVSDTVSHTRSGDTYQGVARRYVTFTLEADSYVCVNLYNSTSLFTLYRPMVEKGDTPSAWETGAMARVSQVKQTADTYDIELRSALGEAGIHIDGTNREIDLIAGKVNFKTASGDPNVKISINPTDGSLECVDGYFSGTVKADNFYNGICDWKTPTIYYCLVDWEHDGEEYEAGNYYEFAEDSPLNPPPSDYFSACSGSANIVMIPSSLQGGDLTISLPLASDYEGKMVEIIDDRYTQPSGSTYVAPLYVRQADGAQVMKASLDDTGAAYQVRLNGNYDHTGWTYRLYCKKTNGVCYWHNITPRRE